ncbi:hypothetical protein [Gordonia alkanivorans]|uniref:hypothetical protein n=1 Tax=Gordonia alkanivorans TaxID=84096 RepID=UPI001F4D7CE6|nr:hypothetical protein [Gordonia alkanivorans]
MTTSDMSPERRAEIGRRWKIDQRDTWHRTTNPDADADLEALRTTAEFGRNVSNHKLLTTLVDRIVRHMRVGYPDDAELEKHFNYEKSNMARRDRLPWRAGGYRDKELCGFTQARYLAMDRYAAFVAALRSATDNASGTIDVVLVHNLLGDAPWRFYAYPTIPNPACSPPDYIGQDEELGAIDWENVTFDDEVLQLSEAAERRAQDREEPDAYSVRRVAHMLLSIYATCCIPCQMDEVRDSDTDFATLIGRGQRVLVIPMCGVCHVKFHDPESPRLQGIAGDYFIENVGWPSDDKL